MNKSVFVFLSAFWRRKKKIDLDPFGAFAFSERQFLVGGSFTILGTAFLVLWAFSSLLELFPASVGLRASFGIFLGSTFSWP